MTATARKTDAPDFPPSRGIDPQAPNSFHFEAWGVSMAQQKRQNPAGGRNLAKKQRPLLVEIFEALPPTYKGALIGLLGSIVPMLTLSAGTTDDMRIMILLPPLVFSLVGFLLGPTLLQKS